MPKNDPDDYLNLHSTKQTDDFALGESNADELTEGKNTLPNAVYIVPIVGGFAMLVFLALSIFVFRVWDETPGTTNEAQSIRVKEDNQPIIGKQKTIKTSIENKINTPTPITSPITNPINNPTPLAKTEISSNSPIATILESALPAVGMVLVKTSANKISSGSGFMVTNDGLFVTNCHVIEDWQEIAVKLNNSEKIYLVDAVNCDTKKDLAVLRFREAGNYPILDLEENFTASLGDDVVILGYPLGTKLGVEVTLSTGIISSTRNISNVSMLQTNAAINHGNSGGPMISRRSGKVIGIVTAKVRDSESIGLAININELKSIVSK